MLPPGFSIHPTTGAISGQTTVAGTYVFTVQAIDSTGKVARRRDTIIIYPNPTVTFTLPSGQVGVAYTGQVNASLGSEPYTYTKDAGPSWASVNSSTGEVTGTPDLAAAPTLTVTVTGTLGGSTTEESTAFIIAPA